MTVSLIRRWQRDNASTWHLCDAAGHPLAFIQHKGANGYVGMIFGREGRADHVIERLGHETRQARANMEQALLTVPMGQGEAALIACALASPIRPVAGRTAAVDGLALFDHARQPTLF